jgi:O-antigen/teichoic acid export membrane protein
LSFLRGFSVNAIAGGLTFLLAFANQAFIARFLGAHGLGRLTMAATTVTIIGMVLGEWLARGNGFFSGRDPGAVGSVWHNTVGYSLAVLCVLMAAAWGMSVVAGDFLSKGQTLLLAAMATAVVAQKGFSGILQGCDRLTAFALIPLLFVSTYLVGNGIGLGWLQSGLTGVLVAWLCGASLAALLAAGLSRAVGSVDGKLLRSTAIVGGRGALSATLIYLLFRSDVFLVEHYLGAETLGVYTIAIFVAEMMQRGPNIAGAVLLPKVLRGIDDNHVMSLVVSRWVLLFSLLCAFGVIVIGGPLIGWIFGATFAAAHLPLMWMLPGLVASGFGSVLNTKLAGQGYPPVTMWAPGMALAANVALNLVLIPQFGLVGAALSTSIAYGLWAVLVTIAYHRITGLAWRRFLRSS